MKKLLAIVVLGLLWISITTTSVFSDSNIRKKILDFITSPDGDVTEEMHKIFWSGVPISNDINNKANFDLMLDLHMMNARIDLWKELWTCALISYDKKEIFKSKKYKEAKEAFDSINYSGIYNDPELKNIDNENFNKAIERVFIAASKNEDSYIDFNLKRRSLDKNLIKVDLAKALLMSNRLEILGQRDYFK